MFPEPRPRWRPGKTCSANSHNGAAHAREVGRRDAGSSAWGRQTPPPPGDVSGLNRVHREPPTPHPAPPGQDDQGAKDLPVSPDEAPLDEDFQPHKPSPGPGPGQGSQPPAAKATGPGSRSMPKEPPHPTARDDDSTTLDLTTQGFNDTGDHDHNCARRPTQKTATKATTDERPIDCDSSGAEFPPQSQELRAAWLSSTRRRRR